MSNMAGAFRTPYRSVPPRLAAGSGRTVASWAAAPPGKDRRPATAAPAVTRPARFRKVRRSLTRWLMAPPVGTDGARSGRHDSRTRLDLHDALWRDAQDGSGEKDQREQDEDEQSHAAVEALPHQRELRGLLPLLGGQHQA